MGNTVISKPKTAFVHYLYYFMGVIDVRKMDITIKCYNQNAYIQKMK